MKAVIDVGSHEHAGETSIPTLLERFTPNLLVGLDPHPDHHARVWLGPDLSLGTLSVVTQIRAAAWTFDGTVPFEEDGTRSHVFGSRDGATVPSVSLSRLVRELHADGFDVIVKLDCEGAEYNLVADLADSGTDTLIERLLIEWHPPRPTSKALDLQERLRCPVEHWGATLEVLSE